MAKKVSLVLAVLVTMMCSYALHRVTAQDAKPLKVGVIVVNRFPEEYIPFKNRVAKLQAGVEQVKAELRKMEVEIKDLGQRRELFDEGSDKWLEYTSSIEKIKIEAATKLQFTKKHLEGMERIYLKKLYADIGKATDTYSRKNGYDFVFIKTAHEPIGKDAKEITMSMYIKTVVYAGEEHDITSEVIEMMNTTVNTDGMQ
jgi:Skp family chaperone for outer membrane proteins